MTAFKFKCSMIRDLEKLFLEKINLEDEWWNSDYDSVSFIDSTSHDMTECIHCCRVIDFMRSVDLNVDMSWF